MCGINAILKLGHPPEWIEAMNAALLHRGPDEGGIYRDESAGLSLGSRRLKIIDLEHGRMPYRSPCGRYAMVYNGEIYNYKELSENCSNYAFTSSSDGEVLFALLQSQGIEVLKKANGMFAFVFWDEQEKKLWVGRDRWGIKPLFYVQGSKGLLISSEIRGLLTWPEIDLELDNAAIAHYFSMLYFCEPASVYSEIRRFPAGQVGEFFKGQWTLKPYAQLSFAKKNRPVADWKRDIRKAFREAVARQLMADVPLGLLLSGGIDSTLVAKIAVEEGGAPLVCHSMSFEGGEDESLLARETARQLNCEFHHHNLKESDFLEHLPELLRKFGEPFAGGLPLWFLCREAKKSFTVGLTGTGGDELFGNYGRVQHLSPRLGWRRGIASWIKSGAFWPEGGWAGLRTILREGASLGTFYHEKVYAMKERDKLALLNFTPPSTEAFLNRRLWQLSPLALEDRVFNLDVQTQLKDEFLYSQDILSMDHSMELRVPFLDDCLVELMASVPVELRSQWRDPKAWMREIFVEELPLHILNKPKSGFCIPYGQWLKTGLRDRAEQLFAKDFVEGQNFFIHSKLMELWHRHLNGERGLDYAIWSIFIFQVWWNLEPKK